MRLVFSLEDVRKTNLARLYSFLTWDSLALHYFKLPAGQEHYQLLGFLSQQIRFPSLISDVGTYRGASALALALNPLHRVETYDFCDHLPSKWKTVKNLDNVKFTIGNAFLHLDRIAQSDLIFLDIDPHDGEQEGDFVEALRKRKYRGLLLLDDIRLNTGMGRFWYGIPEAKLDLTAVGHWSGTGLVMFDPTLMSVQVVEP